MDDLLPPKIARRPWFVSYGLAIVFTFISLLLRLALSDVLSKSSALLMFYPAILASAWVGGFGAGLLSTAIAVYIGIRFFMLPAHTLNGIGSPGGVGLAVFIGVGLTFSILVESTKRAQAKAAVLLVATQKVAQERSVLYDAERRAREELEGALQRLDVLQKVTSALSEAATARQVAEVLVRQMVAIGEAEVAAFFAFNSRANRLELRAQAGGSAHHEDIDTADDICPASYAARHSEAVWLENEKAHDDRFPKATRELCGAAHGALIALPLSTRPGTAETRGVL